MYRIGHGDCFLLAFEGESADKPVYVLIDCGYKPGSPDKIERPTKKNVRDITANIRDATGGEIDVAIITHEHQDHVNGITEKNFEGINIKETWLAWTEDPTDKLANALRKRFKDKLLGLLEARNRLHAGGNKKEAERIDQFLAFELGGSDEEFDATAAMSLLGAAGSGESMNKKSMKVFKDRATRGVKFIRPHGKIHPLPGAKATRVFALGPPRKEEQILDVDPVGPEEFHGLEAFSAVTYFANALSNDKKPPFDKAYCIPEESAFSHPDQGDFFTRQYGNSEAVPTIAATEPQKAEENEAVQEVPSDAAWRRIDDEWLFSALQLAIEVNNATNNTSLVLAFELGKGGKVLLFAADAQRGNWISWAGKSWRDEDKKITAKDLLSRTVLYKVGHHGSHNATLNGLASDTYANLNWMGQGDNAGEFTAMITAVRKWAETQNGWDHPLKAIKDALLLKCSGRVFQTDTDFDNMKMSEGESEANWNRFKSRVTGDTLFFDYRINP